MTESQYLGFEIEVCQDILDQPEKVQEVATALSRSLDLS